jgi:anti-sigma factor RsiW
MRSGGIKPPVSEAELHGYVDGELSRKRQKAVLAHLSASPEDSFRVEIWRRQNEAIRATFSPVGTAQLPWPPLLPWTPRKRGYHRWRERWPAYPVVLAFAGGGLLAGSAVFVASRINLLDVSSPSRAALMSAVTNDSPVEQAVASLGEFEAKAGGGFSPNEIGQGPEVPVMPALSAEGLKLAGIRAIPYGPGQMLCLYYAKPDGSHIALCADNARESGETAATLIGRYPMAAIFWRQGGANYVLAGALSEASLQSLAGEVRDQIEAYKVK